VPFDLHRLFADGAFGLGLLLYWVLMAGGRVQATMLRNVQNPHQTLKNTHAATPQRLRNQAIEIQNIKSRRFIEPGLKVSLCRDYLIDAAVQGKSPLSCRIR
jgi:hypothetical protein